MRPHPSLLVSLILLLDKIPLPPLPEKRGRGRPTVSPDRLFLKALIVMISRHRNIVHELLSVLEPQTPEMQPLRTLFTHNERFPSRRTWARRLNRRPDTLPAQIAGLGRYLVALIQPWTTYGRAVAIESTVLRAGVSGTKKRELRALCPIPPLIPKPIGPKVDGIRGCMGGNCIWLVRWLRFGFRWRRN